MSPDRGVAGLLRRTFWTPAVDLAPLDGRTLTRVRIVAAATLAAGAVLLWLTLRISPGDAAFYPAAVALAVVWALGGVAGARPRIGWVRDTRGRQVRPVVSALLIGLGLVGLFLFGALVVARIPALRGPVQDLLDHARFGSLAAVLAITVVNGVAEELFFRGTLYDALPARRAIAGTAVVYVLVTAASGVPLLVLAAVLLGTVTALQRRGTGGLFAPALTHLVWASSMLLLPPPLLDRAG